MLIGIVLILTWLILLLRYPAKALPLSMAAVAGLGLVAAWVLWQESIEENRFARLEIQLRLDPEQCPADRPLAITLRNGTDAVLQNFAWQVQAMRPGDTINLAQASYDRPRYLGPAELQPGASWQDCLPLPPIRQGYRAQSLEFRAADLRGTFVD
ncbi:multidrug transporter [Pseudomonas sp. Q1-7]|uniref:multidrug transporter n=1 Tax=Pseudomonas sp. Q1-7 TaxID=3020843 RepID=UPI002301C656|nr:multidrug transporter [Pseudomonas sp. Q1-7]